MIATTNDDVNIYSTKILYKFYLNEEFIENSLNIYEKLFPSDSEDGLYQALLDLKSNKPNLFEDIIEYVY